MWSFFRSFFRTQRDGSPAADLGPAGTSHINAVQLASLFSCASQKLMVFDLRSLTEIEQYPRTIPGALLTTHVDLCTLVPWIPPETIVVLYATEEVPRRFAQLTVSPGRPKIRLLDGGLQLWCQEGLPVENVKVAAQRLHEKG